MAAKGPDDAWFETVVDVFQRMNDENRNKMLDMLLGVSSYDQKRHVTRTLACLENPVDFVRYLPMEMTAVILDLLDVKSLVNCTKVCRHWNHVILNLDSIWLSRCRRFGVRSTVPTTSFVTGLPTAETTKQFFGRIYQIMQRMKSGAAFQADDCKFIGMHVDALHIWKDTLFIAGNGDGVWIVDLKMTNFPFRCISFDYGITSIRGDDKLVLVSTLSGAVHSWDRLHLYRELRFDSHTFIVRTFDFEHEMDLLVSGSADKTVKLFSLRTAVLHRTLREHEYWVLKVLLKRDENKDLLMLTMDKTVILVWKFNRTGGTPKADDFWDDLNVATRILIRHDNSWILAANLHFYDEHVFYIQQIPDTHKSELCKFDLRNNRLAKIFKLDVKVKMFIAVGRDYACFLLVDTELRNLLILDLNRMEYVATLHMPYGRFATNMHNPRIWFADQDWLHDGFDGFNHRGIIMAVGRNVIQGSDICLIKWKEDEWNTRQKANIAGDRMTVASLPDYAAIVLNPTINLYVRK